MQVFSDAIKQLETVAKKPINEDDYLIWWLTQLDCESVYSIQKYVIWDFETSQTLVIINDHKLETFILILFFVIHIISYIRMDWKHSIAKLKLPYWFLFLLAIMVSILLLYDGNPIDFVYFKF